MGTVAAPPAVTALSDGCCCIACTVKVAQGAQGRIHATGGGEPSVEDILLLSKLRWAVEKDLSH